MRGFALVGRFALTLFIAKYLDVKSVGYIGIVTGSIAIGPAILGLGFNYFLTRELAGSSPSTFGPRIRDRVLISFLGSALFAIAAAPFLRVFLEIQLLEVAILSAIFCLEVVAFDLNMALISINQSVIANSLQFIRSAGWVFPYILLGFYVPSSRSTTVLMFFWLGGLLVTAIAAGFSFRSWPWKHILRTPVDWNWYLQQTVRGTQIYFSDLAIIAIQFFDRFVITLFMGLTSTGIFIFFWSFANAVQLLVIAAVIQLASPSLVTLGRERDLHAWQSCLNREIFRTTLTSMLISIAAFIGVVLLLPHLRNSDLSSHLILFVVLLVACSLRSVAELLAVALYSLSEDKYFVYSNVISAVAGSLLTLATTYAGGLVGAAIAALVSSAATCGLRLYFLKRSHKKRVIHTAIPSGSFT